MFITELLTAVIDINTMYQRYNTNSKWIDIASCNACKNISLVVENTILIIYYSHAPKAISLIESIDGPADNTPNSDGLGVDHRSVPELTVPVYWQHGPQFGNGSGWTRNRTRSHGLELFLTLPPPQPPPQLPPPQPPPMPWLCGPFPWISLLSLAIPLQQPFAQRHCHTSAGNCSPIDLSDRFKKPYRLPLRISPPNAKSLPCSSWMIALATLKICQHPGCLVVKLGGEKPCQEEVQIQMIPWLP